MATSPGYTATATGTDYWVATYNGDSNNSSVSSAPTAEPVSITPASPTISTTPGGSVVLGSGTALSDSATLASGYNETGTIVFYLFAPGVTPQSNGSGGYTNDVYTDTVSNVSGNGTYTTASGTSTGSAVPATLGTYEWVVVYSGNANNNGVTSTFGSEGEAVTTSTLTITKTADCTQICPGQTAGYTVTITNTGSTTA